MKTSPDFLLQRLRRWPLVACSILLAACMIDPSSVRGELGKGVFKYSCDSSMRDCTNDAATVFPKRVAVSTRFDLSFEANAGTASTGTLQPASEQLLEIRDSSWRTIQEGTVGILDVLPDGSLYDYTFVTIEAAANVRFFLAREADTRDPYASRSDQSGWDPILGTVQLSKGQNTKLVAEAQAADGSVLAGESLLEFTCDAPGIVELVRPTRRPARFALGGVGAGSTTCTIQALGFKQTFDVTVSGTLEEPEEDAGHDAGPIEHDAATDAGDQDGGAL